MHDEWHEKAVDQLYLDLEILVPPKDLSNFSIYLLSSLNENKYGEVLTSNCDDYDYNYKVEAIADDKQNINIKIYREEYNPQLIPNAFFERPFTQKFPNITK